MQILVISLSITSQPVYCPHWKSVVYCYNRQLIFPCTFHKDFGRFHSIFNLAFKSTLQIVCKGFEGWVIIRGRNADKHFTKIDIFVLVRLIIITDIGYNLITVKVDVCATLFKYLVCKFLNFLVVIA